MGVLLEALDRLRIGFDIQPLGVKWSPATNELLGLNLFDLDVAHEVVVSVVASENPTEVSMVC